MYKFFSLARCGIPQKLISLIWIIYSDSVSCVCVGNGQSEWFVIASGVCQGCVVARDALATGMDWVLEMLFGRGMNGQYGME